MARISLACAVVACIAVSASGASGSGSTGRWVATDLIRLARHRFPRYVQIEPIGFGLNGEVLWTAREPHAAGNPRRYTDGSQQHVFGWQNGKTRDLGSFGQSDNTVIAVNQRDQIAVSRFSAVSIPVGGPAPPPPRSFLWEHGRFTDLGTLGGRMSFAAGLNDRGQIVGSSLTGRTSGGHPVSHAFLWQRGKMTDLGTLGGRWSDAAAIDDQGQIVGSSATRSGDSHAFLWQAGEMTDLGTLGGRDSEAVAVNEQGQVIGVSATAGSPRQMTRAFLWQNGKMIDLGVSVDPYRISLEMNGGEVVGATGPGNEPTGFVWSGGKAISLGTSIPTGVDSRGDVVGGTAARSFREHVFIWRDGSFTLLPGPALASTPRAWIDSDGKRIVAVSDETAGMRRRILLWTRAS